MDLVKLVSPGLVTEPEEFAMGDAVALIPPTSDAIAAVGLNKDSTSVPTV